MQDLERAKAEARTLAQEAEDLERQLAKEREETATSVARYQQMISGLERENRSLQQALRSARLGEQQVTDEATSAPQRVAREKAEAIQRLLEDLQHQQEAAFAKIHALTGDIVSAFGSSPVADAGENRGAGTSAVPPYGSGRGPGGGNSGGRGVVPPPLPRPAASAAAGVAPKAAGKAEQELWFEAVKANLEEFGDVEVFADASLDAECACCMEPMSTPYRVRPRKCRHTFHIDCLLQSWTEGVCPVCGVSFAPEQMQTPVRAA